MKVICEEIGSEIPFCDVCKHRHIQGIKCLLCGHIGRSNIYPKMKSRAIEKRSNRIEFYDRTTLNENWDMIEEIRTQLFCQELGISHEDEFNNQIESESHHCIAWVGDAPIAIGRISITTSIDGKSIAIIDRFGVIKSYRGNGVSKQCLNEIYQYLQPYNITSIYYKVPIDSWITQKLLSIGMHINEDIPKEMRGNFSYGYMLI